MSKSNIIKMLDNATSVEVDEGKLAYFRYNEVLRNFAEHYDYPLENVTGVFCALSPNNDYFGNLRSMVSVLSGLNEGKSFDDITVSTYRHSLERAILYAKGTPFLDHAKGLKTRAFYMNLLHPKDKQFVTVDGHIKAAWVKRNLTMKEATVGIKEYRTIQTAFIDIANEMDLIPNQLQAIIWLTRKRLLNIMYPAQLDMFYSPDDKWKTMIQPKDCPPYERKINVTISQN